MPFVGELIQRQKETVGLNRGGGGRDATGSRVEPVDAAPTLAEADEWADIEREAARLRMSLGGGDKKSGRDTWPHPIADTGKSRDAIAARVGIGSGRTYERAN